MGSAGVQGAREKRQRGQTRYYAVSAPQLYKALSIAHRRAREDEAWKIIHESINNVLVKVERLEYLASRLGAGKIGWLGRIASGLLEAVERGDKKATVERLDEASEVLASVGPYMEYAYVTSTGVRLTAAMLSLLASLVLGFGGVPAELLDPVLVLVIALTAGVSLSAVITAGHYLSEYLLAVVTGSLAGLLSFAVGREIQLTLEAVLASLAAIAINVAAILYTDYTRRRVRRVLRMVGEQWGSGS